MKLPKVRHRKGKYLGKNLWECTDQRSSSEGSFEGSSGGGGYLYYGYTPTVIKKVESYNRRLLRLIERRKATQLPVSNQSASSSDKKDG